MTYVDYCEKIDELPKEDLPGTISILMIGRNQYKDKLIKRCEDRMEEPTVNDAIVEQCDMSDFGGE